MQRAKPPKCDLNLPALHFQWEVIELWQAKTYLAHSSTWHTFWFLDFQPRIFNLSLMVSSNTNPRQNIPLLVHDSWELDEGLFIWSGELPLGLRTSLRLGISLQIINFVRGEVFILRLRILCGYTLLSRRASPLGHMAFDLGVRYCTSKYPKHLTWILTKSFLSCSIRCQKSK